MRHALQILALTMMLAGLTIWLGKGVNVGWTKTSKTVMQIDPVTQIQYPTYEPGFYPGIDFLATALLTGAGLLGASFAVRQRHRIRT